jgi:hypothetical protein
MQAHHCWLLLPLLQLRKNKSFSDGILEVKVASKKATIYDPVSSTRRPHWARTRSKCCPALLPIRWLLLSHVLLSSACVLGLLRAQEGKVISSSTLRCVAVEGLGPGSELVIASYECEVGRVPSMQAM